MNLNVKAGWLIFSVLVLVGCDQSPQDRSGEAIYYRSCVSCHERGHGGAPIRGNKKQWDARLAKGKQKVFENLKQGYAGMPAKGACFSCSDQELERVLQYIIHSQRNN
ncbi:cytochrome c5 family protein [Kangiella sp. TOML190]|uniref:c-type cytochrome n=1 Tax=Kangiella sp. TOML190 TaxID=2931351 RepID=UPI00203B26F8|nr:c-type cytochrome [Kangiella sp. TOML190]